MLCKRCLCRHAVSVTTLCMSACVSVTFVNSVKTNKHIIKKFSPSRSHTILVFPCQTVLQYSNGNPPGGGVECRWGRQKSWIWAYICLYCLLLTQQQARCRKYGRRWTTATFAQVCVWHISGSKRRYYCGRRRRNVYDKKPRCYAKDNRTAHLTARSV